MRNYNSVYRVNTFGKHLNIEYAIDAKAFCNYFSHFYYAGCGSQSLKLIRAKHAVTSLKCSLPLPLKIDDKHHVSFALTNSNNLKNSLGVNQMTIKDHL